MIDVNLLKDQRKKLIQEQQQEKKRNKAAYVVLVVGIVLLGLIQVGQMMVSMRKDQIETKIAEAEAELKRYRQDENDSAQVIKKIKESERILGNRVDASRRLAMLFAIFDGGSVLKSMEFSGISSGAGLNLDGSADNVYTYISFSDRLVKLADDQGFDRINQGNLSRGQDTRYSFNYIIIPGESDGKGGR